MPCPKSCDELLAKPGCIAWFSHIRGFSCCRAWALEHQARLLWHTGLVSLLHVESSQIRDQTCVPCIGRQILIHCTPREEPPFVRLNNIPLCIYVCVCIYLYINIVCVCTYMYTHSHHIFFIVHLLTMLRLFPYHGHTPLNHPHPCKIFSTLECEDLKAR